jgi:monoamine oxidase
MARTPLLRSLQRLSREHSEAARLGITVAEVRERHAEAAYSRGEFLKRAGAAGAAIAVGGPAALASPARAAGGQRIAIVGGGIAGLTAALTLADKGITSTVYEASNRVGGRMHSDTGGYWANGQVSEFCGELIDTSHKTILQLAQRSKLSTVDLLGAEPMGSTDTYFFFGSYYSKEQADKDFQRIHQALQRDLQDASYPTTYKINTPGGIALDNMSVYDWIESRVPDGHRSPMGQLLNIAYNIEYGAETTVQSALNLVYLLGFNAKPGNFQIFGLSNERYHIVGGNEQLPQAIAATLPDIRRGWRMNSIFLNQDGTVGLAFDDQPTVTADHVILAMSFAVLRTLDYSRAGFDDLKKTAITQLGVGRNAKLQLQFRDRLWNNAGPWGLSNGASYADTGYQNTWDVSRGQEGTTGILVDYTGGDVAGSFTASTPYSNATTNPQIGTYAKRFLKQIEPVFPGISQRWTGKATLSVPLLDPNLLTSYSYWKVGQYHSFSGYEGEPQGPAKQIHFAGEHCSQDFQGFMEGGASEGVRAAAEVLAALK